MAGRKTLRSIRIGRETTNGTRMTPRYLWRGTGDWVTDEREIIKVEELIGISGGTDRTYIPKLKATVELAETEATYPQLPPLFVGLGFATVSGFALTGNLSSGTWQYAYHVPSTVFPQNFSFTIEAGDNIEAQVAIYCVTDELKLTFAAGEAMKVSASLLSQYGTRTNAEGSFSTVGTLEPVQVILASRGSVFLAPESESASIASYKVPNGNILGGELTFKANWAPKYWLDGGSIFAGTMVLTGHEITGNLIFEHQRSGTYGAAGSLGQIEKWRNEQAQIMQLTWQDAGNYFNVLLPIKWDNLQDYDDQDGNNIVTGEFTSRYNETLGNRGQIRVFSATPSRIIGTA